MLEKLLLILNAKFRNDKLIFQIETKILLEKANTFVIEDRNNSKILIYSSHYNFISVM